MYGIRFTYLLWTGHVVKRTNGLRTYAYTSTRIGRLFGSKRQQKIRMAARAVLWIWIYSQKIRWERKNSVDPGSWFLTIPDLGSKNSNKREGWKKFVRPFYGATNFTKLYIILVLKCRRKKFGPIFKELYNFLPKKMSLSSQKYGLGIRDPENTYSGYRIPGSKRHRIPDPQHWEKY